MFFAVGDPWLDKRAIAKHFGCLVRSIEYAVTEGLPHAIVFGRPKFQIPHVEAWLERTGRLERRGTMPEDELGPAVLEHHRAATAGRKVPDVEQAA
jgi:hypothetical protein